MKYRKKPVVIEAIQFKDRNLGEICNFVGKENMVVASTLPHITIVTLEGKMKAQPNDFIIKGVKGEFYPCKPDIFEMTYEMVE
jgi:hypothetical protein